VGIVCGSGGDLVAEVARAGCATLLTGEVKLHDALAAAAAGLAVVAVGHHASERFSLDVLGRRLTEALPGLTCQPSTADTDPFVWQAI
jgi:putative NIF3 family GTP cyclohydrolase 1 type 2